MRRLLFLLVLIGLTGLPHQINAGDRIRADLNGDGAVNFADYVLFVKDFGRTDGLPYDPNSPGDTITVTVTLTVRDTIRIGPNVTPPSITVIPSAGIQPTSDLYSHFESVRDVFCKYLDYVADSNILVEFSQSKGPAIFYERSSRGEYRIRLHKPGIFYGGGFVLHGLVLQFAHEYGHILSNYRDDSPYSQQEWFEESIANLASIFAMREIKDVWVKDYLANPSQEKEAQLRQFQTMGVEANFMIRRGREYLGGKPLGSWYIENRHQLETEPVKSLSSRDRQEAVSVALLGIFETYPEDAWDAVRYMNRGHISKNRDFLEYLQEWYRRTPPQWQYIVVEIMSRFGFRM